MEPQTNQFCEVAGQRIAYQRHGFGETILLVHGITTYSFIWRKLYPALSVNYDVIAVDLLGCGNSDKTLSESYSLPRHAELLNEFVDQLKTKCFHFIGHDVGGGIGQIYAVNYPDRLYDLTLINSIAYDFWPVQPITALRTPIVRQLIMAVLNKGTFKQIVQRGMCHKERVDTELVDLFWGQMQTSAGRKAFLHFAKCLNNQHLVAIEKDLKRLELPVLIIRDDADVYLSSEISTKLYSDIPNSRLEHIATGGHYIQEDEPEKLIEITVQFFKETQHADH